MSDENVLLTTAQVSAQLGCTDVAIRTAKSRNKDLLLEGSHWINDAGRTLWTSDGVAVLSQLLGGHATVTEALDCNGSVQADAESLPSDDLEWLDEALDPLADRVACTVIQNRLRLRVLVSLQRFTLCPTEADQQKLNAIVEQYSQSLSAINAALVFGNGLGSAIAQSQPSLKAIGGQL